MIRQGDVLVVACEELPKDVSRVAVRAVTQGVIVCVLVDAMFIVLYLVT